MKANRIYHFVLTWQNVDNLKKILNEVHERKEVFIDVQFTPPKREKVLYPASGKYRRVRVPAEISFLLYEPVKWGWNIKDYADYSEDEEDKGTGIAFPPGYQ